MKVLQLKALEGPNVFHHKPVLVMQIDLGENAELCSAELPGFNERLLALLPGLHDHHCSPGYPGGFVERLDRGTYFAHIIEHIALEMSQLAGIGVAYGKSVYDGAPGRYRVAVRYRNEAAMRHLLLSAVEVLECIAEGRPASFEEAVSEAQELVRATGLGPSTQAIVSAAEKRGIPWQRLSELSLIQLGYGKHRRLIQATTSSLTSDIAVDIAQDKDLTKQMLERAAIRVPRGEIVRSAEEAVEALRALGVPVAVKPLDGNHGNGVSLGITTEEAVRAAFERAAAFGTAVLVEELFTGFDHRVLVIGGKLAAAAKRVPAHVVGDGVLNVAELVEKENRNPLRGEGHEKPMTRLRLDPAAFSCLSRQGFLPGSVPAAGSRVFLSDTANISQGGSAIDVTDLLHPETRAVCERAARIVGLDICGIDLVVDDITRPLSAQRGGIIEVNAGPGIRMHHFPSEGQPREVGGMIVDSLYPPGSPSRIPIVSVTGTNGKTTVARLTGHILSGTGLCVGVTTSDGIHIGNQTVSDGDTTGPASARAVLCDPAVEAAVLETARGGIVRRGLGYDWSDVGVITNVQADHFGQDGIETLEDVFHIKKLVAERVREGGTLVLNAEDPLLAGLGLEEAKRDPKKRIAWFSLDPNLPFLRERREAGDTAYLLRDGWILECAEGKELPIAEAARIPLTFKGTAGFHVANAMAAAAAARALGLSVEQAERGLYGFRPNFDNAGRANFYRAGRGFLLMDYGHNPEAIRAIGRMASSWKGRRITAVIAAPGDRSDEMLRMTAAAAAPHFSRILVREDEDLRGRRPGEVAGILCEAVRAASPGKECLIERDGSAAFERALREMEEGEVVVYFYDEIESARNLLRLHGAEPLDDVGELAAGPGRGRGEAA